MAASRAAAISSVIMPVIVPITAAVIVTTAVTHAVFFGSGRYGLVVVPFVAALAFVRSRERRLEGGDEIARMEVAQDAYAEAGDVAA